MCECNYCLFSCNFFVTPFFFYQVARIRQFFIDYDVSKKNSKKDGDSKGHLCNPLYLRINLDSNLELYFQKDNY